MNRESHWAMWRISSVNRRSRARFDRDVSLDMGTLSADQRKAVEQAISRGDGSVLQYRKLFTEQPAQDMSTLVAFNSFFVNDYFEDDAGQPLTTFQFMQILTGHDDIIMPREPESVLRFGPSAMQKPETWTTQNADDVAHFIEVAACLSQSEWVKTPVSVQYSQYADGSREITGFQRPNVLLLNSALAFIRQLVSQTDAVFTRAVNAYLVHGSHEAKKWFIKQRREQFKKTLSEVHKPPFNRTGRSGRELLELLFYGFGLIHRYDASTVADFRSLVDTQGREHVVQVSHWVSMQVVSHACAVAMVVSQDFDQWMQQPNIAKPTRVSITDLLGPI